MNLKKKCEKTKKDEKNQFFVQRSKRKRK